MSDRRERAAVALWEHLRSLTDYVPAWDDAMDTLREDFRERADKALAVADGDLRAKLEEMKSEDHPQAYSEGFGVAISEIEKWLDDQGAHG